MFVNLESKTADTLLCTATARKKCIQ